MKIELTRDQLGNLVKLVYLGSWMANSWRTEEEIQDDLVEVENIILTAAARNGFREYVEVDEEEGKVYPSAELDEKMDETIDSYNDHTFWDEIIIRMAERDFVRRHGEDALDELGTEEGQRRERPLIEKYEKEFYENGLDRLDIRRDH